MHAGIDSQAGTLSGQAVSPSESAGASLQRIRIFLCQCHHTAHEKATLSEWLQTASGCTLRTHGFVLSLNKATLPKSLSSWQINQIQDVAAFCPPLTAVHCPFRASYYYKQYTHSVLIGCLSSTGINTHSVPIGCLSSIVPNTHSVPIGSLVFHSAEYTQCADWLLVFHCAEYTKCVYCLLVFHRAVYTLCTDWPLAFYWAKYTKCVHWLLVFPRAEYTQCADWLFIFHGAVQ